MPQLNWVQRAILIVAGLLLTAYGIDVASGYGETDGWRALAMGLAAVVCFVLAASSRRTRDAE